MERRHPLLFAVDESQWFFKDTKKTPMISFRKVEKIMLISVSSFCNLPGLKKTLHRGRKS